MMSRIAAIARADAAIRLRRLSTVVVFLLLSAFAYVWIPDPSTGRALMQIAGSRALYNSAAIGMATALLGTMFVGLFGFYVVSNAVKRDVDTRCGLLLASTPMRNGEYVAGKFAGNVAFLTLFMSGFMATSMAMQVVRGEAPLQPLIFIKQYALLVPPSIIFVAAIAVIFESIPLLAGRLGDVFYFFFWCGSLGIVASRIKNGHTAPLAECFDFSSFGYLFLQMQKQFGSDSLAIGSIAIEAGKSPIVFTGLTLERAWILPRLISMLIPPAALSIALVFFHRFDPARIRSGGGSRTSWLARINRLLKPIARAPFALGRGAALTDAFLTFTVAPWTFALLAAVAIAALKSPATMPFALAATAVVVADIACRDQRAGTIALIRSAPRLRESFVIWKLASTTIVAFAMMAVPIARATSPLAAVIATLFIAAIATALGIVSSNPKTFVVLFLTFWYVVINDKGNGMLNFAGMHGVPHASTNALYAAIAGGTALLTAAFYAFRLSRGD
jgi:hypothetical protein